MSGEIQLRRAFPSDAKDIRELVNTFAAKGLMLPRSLASVYDNNRDFRVLVEGKRIIGCAALHISWEDMAEIRSLAIGEEIRGKGWGKVLVNDCLKEAVELKVPRVFTLSYTPEFFQHLGFSEIDKETLPQKIWKDCINCPHFPDCQEVALIYGE
ncbi:MAG: N-acetyltransferase [Candidatus Auribacterota bacterium]|nr:N-acetyltransferase [Candidatus Auribacterota bacterium]